MNDLRIALLIEHWRKLRKVSCVMGFVYVSMPPTGHSWPRGSTRAHQQHTQQQGTLHPSSSTPILTPFPDTLLNSTNVLCCCTGCTGPPPVLSDDSVTWDPSCSDPKPAGTNCMGSCPTGYETTCGTPKAQCHYGSWGFSCANCQPSRKLQNALQWVITCCCGVTGLSEYFCEWLGSVGQAHIAAYNSCCAAIYHSCSCSL